MKNTTLLLTTLSIAVLSGCSQYNEEEIGTIAADYLIKHPEVLVEASQNLKQKEQEKAQKAQVNNVLANKDKLLNANSPYIGPSDAKVAVIEFFDYQCIFCSKLAPEMEKLIQSNPDVKFIFKETPIFANRWPASQYAAQWGLEVFKQKGSQGYQTYHDGVFGTGKNESKLTKEDIHDQVKKAGINTLTLAPETETKVKENLTLFSQLGFRGTPALVVMPIDNPTPENTTVIAGYDVNGLTSAIKNVKKS